MTVKKVYIANRRTSNDHLVHCCISNLPSRIFPTKDQRKCIKPKEAFGRALHEIRTTVD